MDELVFSLSSRTYPLTKVTRDVPQARVFIAYGLFDPAGGRLVAQHTLVAPPKSLPELQAAHREAYPQATAVGDYHNGAAPSVVVDATLSQIERAGSPEAFAFRAFPAGTGLGPAVVREGKMVMRSVVPGTLDLRHIQAVRDATAKDNVLSGFTILRSGEFDPSLAVEAALAEDLTPKQLEVVRAALSLGYYDSPRRITLHHLSELYGISKAAAHNRLQAAERKIMLTFFS